MLAARRLLTAVGGPGFAHGRVELSPELLFGLVMSGLVILYCVDYTLGGEMGASSFYLGSEEQTMSNESKPEQGGNSTVISVVSNSTSPTLGETAVSEKSNGIVGDLYSVFLVGMIAAGSILLLFFLFQKIGENIRTAYFGSNGYNGTRGMSMRNRAHLVEMLGRIRGTGLRNILGRDITPDDYETLLGLDGTAATHRGVSESMINRCPVMTVTGEQIERMTGAKGDHDEEDQGGNGSSAENDYSCTVCLVEYKPGDNIRTLPCLHTYHVDCIDPWLRDRGDCPICKMRVDEV